MEIAELNLSGQKIQSNSKKQFSNIVMQIQGNALCFEDNLIQLSNITRVWLGSVPKESLKFIPILVCILIGLFLLIGGMRSGSPLLNVIGLGFCLIAVYFIYQYKSQKQLHAINMELNSSQYFSFFSEDKDFLKKAFQTIQSIMTDTEEKMNNTTINFTNSNIVNNGNMLSPNSSITDSIISSSIFENPALLKDLKNLLSQYEERHPYDKSTLSALSDAVQAAESKDIPRLQNILKKFPKNLISFAEQVGIQTVSNILAQLLHP